MEIRVSPDGDQIAYKWLTAWWAVKPKRVAPFRVTEEQIKNWKYVMVIENDRLNR